MRDIDKLILLEAIRQTGNSVEFPLAGNWTHLADQIAELEIEGLVVLEDEVYQISDAGKKALLLFNAEKTELLKTLEVYKEVNVDGKIVDARLPVVAYQTRKQDRKAQEEYLEMVGIMTTWDTYFNNIKGFSDAVVWQRVLFSAFHRNVANTAGVFVWRRLGRTLEDAIRTAELLTNPKPSKSLIQITRD